MYYLFVLGKIISLSLPRFAVYFLARCLALSHFYFSRKDREAVFYNLKPLVEGKRKQKKIAREVFINFAYYLVDFFRYSKLNKKFIEKYVKFENLEKVENLLKKRGIVIATAHLGNYELGGAVMALLGYPLAVIALPHREKKLNQFFNQQRFRVKMEVIPTGLAVKGGINILKQKKLLALLGDRDFFNSGRKVELFSRYAFIPRGIAFFAKKSGAAVVPAFFIRENKYYYRLIFEKEIESSNENDIIEGYLQALKKYLKKYPQQWYLFQDYWK